MYAISDKALEKFKKICEKRGIKISDAKARDNAQRLLHLIALTRKTIPKKPVD